MPDRQVINKNPTPQRENKTLDTEVVARVGNQPDKSAASLSAQRTKSNLDQLTPQDVIALRRKIGNLGTVKLIQAKLKVGAADDPSEREADQVAEQVVNGPQPLEASLQRQEEEEEVQTKPDLQRQEEEEEVQTKRVDRMGSFETGAGFERRLQASRSDGQPLPGEVREFMEPRFGANFSSVRLHSGPASSDLNREVSAQAFTLGQDIYLGEGKSNLTSSAGQKLIAHELAHVVQQGGAAAPTATRQVQRFAGYIPTEEEILADTPAGFTFFGKSTYGQIMQEVGNYHKLGQDKYAAQLQQIDKILKMIKAWEVKHGPAVFDSKKKSKSAEQKRREMLAELRSSLELEKGEVTEQTAGNQELTVGATTANPLIQSKKGLIPKGVRVYKEADRTAGPFQASKDMEVSFEGELVEGTKTWLRFKSGADPYLVDKTQVRFGAWKTDKGVLFPEEPKFSHIEQGGLGDCYLLAAITSLVQSDKNKIKDMMHDNGNTVTVRLYDLDATQKPVGVSPRNVTVEKSVAMLNGGELYSRGALWVQMLEKAYAAAGYTGKYDSQSGTFTMESIAGGRATVAMAHLTGKEAMMIQIQPSSLAGTPGSGTTNFPPGVGEREWKTIKEKTEAMFRPTGAPLTEIPYLFVESFEQFFASNEGKKHPFGVRQKVLEWISQKGLYQHEVGTGRYTEAQKKEFDDMVALLKNGKLVTMASKQKIAEGSAGRGHSGGEEMMMGLAGGHEYTVLDYGYGDAGSPQHTLETGTKNAARWFKVRNPWGSYGRQYEWDATARRWAPKKAQSGVKEETEALHETRGGVFWLELGDMTRNFSWIRTG